MAEWTAKRFWIEARVVEEDEGFAPHLDTRPIRTPAGVSLRLPTLPLAEAVAAEWDAQSEVVDPRTMPLTRTANSALDKVAPQREAVVRLLSEYGTTDLLSYRADQPSALAERQSGAWDPMLEWAEETFDARLAVTSGVMPVDQSSEAVANLAQPMGAMSVFQLAAFHDLVTLSGSLVLALATARNEVTSEDAWALSRIDENWQAEIWGRDEEAEAAAEVRRQAYEDAARFYELASEPRGGGSEGR